MTRTLRTLFFILLLAPLSLMAQTPQRKFGHLNTNDLLAKMPKVTEAKAQLEKYTKEFDDQLKELSGEYEKKLAAYQDYIQGKDVSDARKKNMEDELVQLQQRIQKFNQDAKESVDKKQDELLTPIYNEVKEAIKTVAKEGKYSYVFDTSLGAVLYADEADDITALVKKKLGLP
jgi:outer membrane protein